MNTIERYAISSDEWEELSFNPSPVVSCMACCSHENLIYFGGGKNVNWSKIADFNTLDVDLGSIVKKAPMLAPRTSHQITVLNGFIYALGGFDQSGILLSCYFICYSLLFLIMKSQTIWLSCFNKKKKISF